MDTRLATLIAVVIGTASLASAQTSTTPVAYAYVSTPLKVIGYSVATNGRLSPLPHSPYRQAGLTHMSVNKGHLFGSGSDGAHVYTFAINADGSLALTHTVDTRAYKACGKLTATQVDRTGSTLYVTQKECPDNYQNLQQYKIAADGSLQFLGNLPLSFGTMNFSPLYFLSNNRYAYDLACVTSPSLGNYIASWRRTSLGDLVFNQFDIGYPAFAEHYCAAFLATDNFNHAAIELVSYTTDVGVTYNFQDARIDSFTADSEGNLRSTNGLNAPVVALKNGDVTAMSISPAGNLLAMGGHYGFQIFRFNGANPVKHYSSVLQPNNQFLEFGWDSHSHLYALSTDGIRLYNINTTAYSEAPGSPVSISDPTSVIVVSLP